VETTGSTIEEYVKAMTPDTAWGDWLIIVFFCSIFPDMPVNVWISGQRQPIQVGAPGINYS
jgi:hypothetical protein